MGWYTAVSSGRCKAALLARPHEGTHLIDELLRGLPLEELEQRQSDTGKTHVP